MTRTNETRFASITVVPGAAHFVSTASQCFGPSLSHLLAQVPQENPHGLAKLVLQIVRGMGFAAKL